MNPFAVAWTALITVIFCLPFVPAAVPFNENFDWKSVNYAPITVIAVLVIVGIWWKVSAHKWFQGTVRQVDLKEELNPQISGS